MSGTRIWYGLAVLGVLVFLASAGARLGQTVGQDEMHYLFLANTIYNDGYAHGEDLIVCSPHLYSLLIVGAYSLFGQSLVTARLPGIAAWTLCLLMLGALAGRCAGPDAQRQARAVGISVFLCATIPAVSQAAVIVEIDNSVLPAAILFLVWSFYGLIRQSGWKPWCLTAAAMSVALWCRVTTPIIIAPFMMAAGVLCADREGRVLARIASALAAGSAIFVGTWWVYCRLTHVVFLGPFDYTLQALGFCTVGARGVRLSQVAQNLVYMTLWIGPFTLLLFVAFCGCRCLDVWRVRSLQAADLFWITGAWILAGYTVVGGTLFGFPKYHCPGLPLLCVGAGLLLAQELPVLRGRQWVLGVGLCAIAAAVQVLVQGDLLLTFRLTLRAAQALGEPPVAGILRQVALSSGLACLAWGLLGAGAWFWGLRGRWGPILLFVALGANFGAVLTQATAGYQTGYNYGDPGWARELAELLRQRVSSDAPLIVPGEIDILLGRPAPRHTPNWVWDDSRELARRLADPRTQALATSVITHTTAQVRRTIRDPAIRDVLTAEYEAHPIGAYFVWLRRSPSAADGSTPSESRQKPSPTR